MKTILILRHAKSDRHGEMPDFDRPLNARGKRNAKLMARFLSHTDLIPQKILSSPAVRSKSTVKAILDKTQNSIDVEYLNSFYLGSANAFFQALHSLSEELDCVLLCGHNPALEEFVENICCHNLDLHLPTCGLIVLQNSEKWQDIKKTRWQLRGFYHPKLLNKFLEHTI